MWSPNDPRLKRRLDLADAKKERKFFGMTEDEAYDDYVKFCAENNIKAETKQQFLDFMGIADEFVGNDELE